MRALLVSALVLTAACGGSSTATVATRYNFAVVDGLNQLSTAGAASLAKPVTSQLTRDPQGKFATRVLDFFAPAVAYAQQGLNLAGEPVQNAIVCGRESAPGEPKVIPLCAFTLADGKAANTIQGGTKAGVYNILFTAQVPSENPVVDSTTVTVEAGPMTSHVFERGIQFSCWTFFPAIDERPVGFHSPFVSDQFGNPVPYRFVTKGSFAHMKGDVLGTDDARTFVVDKVSDPALHESQPVDVEISGGGVIASGTLEAPSAQCVTLNF